MPGRRGNRRGRVERAARLRPWPRTSWPRGPALCVCRGREVEQPGDGAGANNVRHDAGCALSVSTVAPMLGTIRDRGGRADHARHGVWPAPGPGPRCAGRRARRGRPASRRAGALTTSSVAMMAGRAGRAPRGRVARPCACASRSRSRAAVAMVLGTVRGPHPDLAHDARDAGRGADARCRAMPALSPRRAWRRCPGGTGTVAAVSSGSRAWPTRCVGLSPEFDTRLEDRGGMARRGAPSLSPVNRSEDARHGSRSPGRCREARAPADLAAQLAAA